MYTIMSRKCIKWHIVRHEVGEIAFSIMCEYDVFLAKSPQHMTKVMLI